METVFWKRLTELCAARNSTPTEEVKAAGLAAGNVTYWKNGRIPNVKIIAKLVEYFGVEKDYFVAPEQKENSPSGELDKNAIKFALFGTDEITDEKLNEVLRYAAYVRDL